MADTLPPLRPRGPVGRVGSQEVVATADFTRWLEELRLRVIALENGTVGPSIGASLSVASYGAAEGFTVPPMFAAYAEAGGLPLDVAGYQDAPGLALPVAVY